MPNQRKPSSRARQRPLREHPVRGKIINLMGTYGQPMSPVEIAGITGESLGSVSYHVRTMAEAGLIRFHHEERVRGAAKTFFVLVQKAQPLDAVDDPYALVLKLCGALTVPGATASAFPEVVVLDDGARDDLRNVIETFRPKVREIAAASTKRMRTLDS